MTVDNDIAIETIGAAQATATDEVDESSVDDAASDHDVSGNSGDGTEAGHDEDSAESTQSDNDKCARRGITWSRSLTFGVLPALALLLALGAAFLKWQYFSMRDADTARIESVQAARDSTIAMLSYRPDTVEQQLGTARDLLTGTFSDSYDALVHDVVIPGAKQRQISAVATVPAVASVSASPNHAVTLVFVNQTVIVGNSAPTATASTVRVTLDKVGNRWLISAFDPV